MNGNWFFVDRTADDWRPLARALILISLVSFGFQFHSFMRIRAFAAQAHEVVQRSGRIWLDKAPRGGAWLLLDTGQYRMKLSCETPTVLCVASASVDGSKLAQGSQVSVAWIDGPAGMLSDTAHYPVRIEQRGRLLLAFTPADIVEAQLHNLGRDLILVGGTMFVAPSIFLLIAARRERTRKAAASAAWHRRNEKRDDPIS